MNRVRAQSHPDLAPRHDNTAAVDLNVVDRARDLARALADDETLRRALCSLLGPIEAKFLELLLQASASAEKPGKRRD